MMNISVTQKDWRLEHARSDRIRIIGRLLRQKFKAFAPDRP